MRLGVFGGSFDPPHVGHLIVAVDAFEELRLDHLAFIPAGVQPLKAEGQAAPGARRLEMLRLLVGEDPRFSVDPIEIDREGLSYTVETLAAYADRFPDAERYFLAGADIVATFHRWREPERLARLARVAVLARRNEDVAAEGRGSPAEGGRPALERAGAIFLRTRRVDVSSTELRARVRQGKSVRGFVPDPVAAYIERAGLYR
jgi:nicotinate-nucleotide adenylyltransferase